jgi:hypothetical protein
MSGDVNPEVALRESGRIHTLGTRLMKLGVSEGGVSPVVSPHDLKHLLAHEGGMARLAQGGVNGLYFHEGCSLACMCDSKLPSDGDFIIVTIMTRISVHEFSARAQARGFQLVSPEVVRLHRKDFDSVLTDFWVVDECGGLESQFVRADDRMSRSEDRRANVLYQNAVVVLFRKYRPNHDIGAMDVVAKLGSRLVQVGHVRGQDPSLLHFSEDDVCYLAGPEGAKALLRLVRDGRRSLYVEMTKWVPHNSRSNTGFALLEVASTYLNADRFSCEARLRGLRVNFLKEEARFQKLLRSYDIRGGYMVALKDDPERRYVEVDERFEPVSGPRVGLKKGDRILCYTQP